MRTCLFIAAMLLTAVPALAAPGSPVVYPQPPRADVVDTYWGTPVPDPYRPLENVEAPQTQAWLRAEAAVTRGYLDALPHRAEIKAALQRMYATSAYATAPERHGRFWTTTRRAAGKRNVIYVREGASEPDRPLLDINQLASNVVVGYTAWSRSGRLFAYGTEMNGSEWVTWHVRDVATATDLPDVVQWAKYVEVAFAGDDGFYYSGYDAPADGRADGSPPGFYKAFYHRLGTPQSSDVLLAAAASGSAYPATSVTRDGRYALIVTGEGDDNGFEIFPADQPRAARQILVEPGHGPVYYIANAGSRFFFRVNDGSPNWRIVEVVAGDRLHRARTVVAERADALADASFIGGRFYLDYLHDVHHVLEVADEGGRRIGTIALPGLGTATAPAGDEADGFLSYTYESFTEPRTTYRYDLETGRSTVAARDAVAFDSTPFVTEQLFATSKDGTRVPLFVTHRRDLPYDGSTPTILYGYGAFNALYTLTPSFGSQNALWLQLGGVYAVVNARGGGEYGEAWHRAGMLDQKQHSFDDAIAAAQLLIARKITSPAKLALTGASGGGLLVGAVVTQRPDLFAAAIPTAGAHDMLRFQKLNPGAAWTSENGASDQSETAFRTLYAYSPLHNVRAGTHYPAMLIPTGDHDERVFPAHSYKFAAALQQAQGGDAPILLSVRANAGHEYGVAGTAADGVADRYAFLAKVLDFTPSL